MSIPELIRTVPDRSRLIETFYWASRTGRFEYEGRRPPQENLNARGHPVGFSRVFGTRIAISVPRLQYSHVHTPFLPPSPTYPYPGVAPRMAGLEEIAMDR
jgi:hypothetical protein